LSYEYTLDKVEIDRSYSPIISIIIIKYMILPKDYTL